METILHEDLIPLDTYRTSKSDIIEILNENGILSRDTDTVADLRPILAALKNLTRISASHPNIKTIFNYLTTRKTHLSEEDRENYKDLATIEDFLVQRTNLYDIVHNPEADIKTQAPPTLAQHYEPLTLPDRTNTATMGENIPLISAGTYTGLQSENPQDFLDKFLVAATSNRWTDNTKVNLFPAHLSGTALTWFKHYRQKQRGEAIQWDQLAKSFIEAFTPLAQTQSLQMILEHKIQGENEPTLNYFLDILTTCRRYDPTIQD
ncbi:aspartic-type endopeptidase activity protein, partial [Homalodisca vitripennis]